VGRYDGQVPCAMCGQYWLVRYLREGVNVAIPSHMAEGEDCEMFARLQL
jgi:hypothetical protein